MAEDELAALASTAASTVVAVARTDWWERFGYVLAQVLGRGDPERAMMVESRLAEAHERLAAARASDIDLVYSDLVAGWDRWLNRLLTESADLQRDLRVLIPLAQETLLSSPPRRFDKFENNYQQELILGDMDSSFEDRRSIWRDAPVTEPDCAESVVPADWGPPDEPTHPEYARTDLAPGQPTAPEAPAAPLPRYLRGRCPERVPVGEPFSLLVNIATAGQRGTAPLKPFDVPPGGRGVLLVLHAPGLRGLGQQRQTVHVPANGDSDPVMFELRADTPGPQPIEVTAWADGSYLGELIIEVEVSDRSRSAAGSRDVLAGISMESSSGAVSLVVRYDPRQNAYRFEFRDEDNPEEVTTQLGYEPGPRVERLIAELDDLAKDRTGYSAAQTKNYLINAGAGLWQELIPERLRQQFWARQHRIRQLTILADKDTVPWELLYPMDPGHDAGFLVEQFPVTRAVFGRAPATRLSLHPARFVLPEGSPPHASAEIEAVRRLLGTEDQTGADLITALTPLQNLISDGRFGLLHFACHNRFDPADGSSITLDDRPFTPTLLTASAIQRRLAGSAPTVFINACRTAGMAATYNHLDGWAIKFLQAGAAAFIGSLWSVSDDAGREFACTLYERLQRGATLGEALLDTRRAVAAVPGDPTWLAYTVYGSPHSKVMEGSR